MLNNCCVLYRPKILNSLSIIVFFRHCEKVILNLAIMKNDGKNKFNLCICLTLDDSVKLKCTYFYFGQNKTSKRIQIPTIFNLFMNVIFFRLAELIRNRGTALLKVLNEVSKQKHTFLSRSDDRYSSLLLQSQQAISFIEMALYDTSDTALLHAKK